MSNNNEMTVVKVEVKKEKMSLKDALRVLLRAYRYDRGYSLGQLSKGMGLKSHHYVLRCEKGEREWSNGAILKAIKFLGVKEEDFLYDWWALINQDVDWVDENLVSYEKKLFTRKPEEDFILSYNADDESFEEEEVSADSKADIDIVFALMYKYQNRVPESIGKVKDREYIDYLHKTVLDYNSYVSKNRHPKYFKINVDEDELKKLLSVLVHGGVV